MESKFTQENSKILFDVLVEEWTLYSNTLNAHWNITGDSFSSIHKVLEAQYENLQDIIDEIAERIKILGENVPQLHSKNSSITTENNFYGTIENLCTLYKKIIESIRSSIKKVSETDDFGTEDTLVSVLKQHEKILWILRSHLQS